MAQEEEDEEDQGGVDGEDQGGEDLRRPALRREHRGVEVDAEDAPPGRALPGGEAGDDAGQLLRIGAEAERPARQPAVQGGERRPGERLPGGEQHRARGVGDHQRARPGHQAAQRQSAGRGALGRQLVRRLAGHTGGLRPALLDQARHRAVVGGERGGREDGEEQERRGQEDKDLAPQPQARPAPALRGAPGAHNSRA